MLEIPDTLDDVIKAPASQLLLVCCWRTMKEVALLLGELSENAPLQVGNSKHSLLTAKQVMVLYKFSLPVINTVEKISPLFYGDMMHNKETFSP